MPFGGGAVLFWSGVCFDASTELTSVPRPALTADRYLTLILEDHVVPFVPFISDDFL